MKWFKRIILGLLIAIIVIILVTALSIPADGVLGKDRIDSVTNVTIPGINGGPDVKAYLAKPDGPGPFPGRDHDPRVFWTQRKHCWESGRIGGRRLLCHRAGHFPRFDHQLDSTRDLPGHHQQTGTGQR